MLRAATKQVYAIRVMSPFKALDDIEWVLNQADKIEDLRNDALHSPVILLGTKAKARPAPNHYFGHVRARKLSERDFIAEFRRFRATATKLRDFVGRLDLALLNYPNGSWPSRPSLPTRSENKGPRNRRRIAP
jgi:hypothetical protein